MEKTDWTAFGAVWERVCARSEPAGPVQTGKPAPPEPPEKARLAMFLQETAAGEALCRGLYARSALRWLRELCACLQRQKTAQKRQLQSAYFLLTGDTCPLPPAPVSGDSAPELLRRLLLAEQSTAAAFRDAAGDTESMELSRLYRELAAAGERRTAQLRSALTRLLA